MFEPCGGVWLCVTGSVEKSDEVSHTSAMRAILVLFAGVSEDERLKVKARH